MIMVSFVFLNLFIAIILESFDTSTEEENLKVDGDTVLKFNKYWATFDPSGTGFIKVTELAKFINLLMIEEIRKIY